jgi:hypothetical protein
MLWRCIIGLWSDMLIFIIMSRYWMCGGYFETVNPCMNYWLLKIIILGEYIKKWFVFVEIVSQDTFKLNMHRWKKTFLISFNGYKKSFFFWEKDRKRVKIESKRQKENILNKLGREISIKGFFKKNACIRYLQSS